MYGYGYETRRAFLFHVFVSVFGGAQNTPFFSNYAQLLCEPVRIKNKRLRNVTVNRPISIY